MSARRSRITVGRVSGLYGVRGWVRLQSFTDPPDNLFEYRPWLLEQGGASRQGVPLKHRRHGRGFIARLENIDDRDLAAALVGATITVERTQLPPAASGEYYWADLIGLEVVAADGRSLGVVERLFETGANDVMIVRGDRERLIPWIIGQVVEDVDLERRRIAVRWDPEF